jgi:hypothetical protein
MRGVISYPALGYLLSIMLGCVHTYDRARWELRERREREEERQEAEGLGAEVEEEPPLFLPPPSFMTSAEEE